MKIFDSDFLIDLINGQKEALKKLEDFKNSGEEITTTVFNAEELLFIPFYKNKIREFEDTVSLLKELGTLYYDFDCVLHTLRIKSILSKNGKQIGDADEMIAGICLNNNATLVTRNIDHFSRIPNLKIEKW